MNNLLLKQPLILHFVGICGAGKSTLCKKLTNSLRSQNLNVITTIDYEPDIPDHEKQNERAFNRKLDLLNNQASGKNLYIQKQIVEHSLHLLKLWQRSKADIILIDRWYESYDNLLPEHILKIEEAIKNSGFNMKHVFLKVAKNFDINDQESIKERILHTKENRKPTWFNSVPSLEQWIKEEQQYQEDYEQFVYASTFESLTLLTNDMNWQEYERKIIENLNTNN